MRQKRTIIDTHQHFWKYDKDRHGWIRDDMKSIRRDFLPKDLERVFSENQINGCIAVQSDQTEIENGFLLDLAKEYEFIKGVIGWVDFRAEDIEDRLQYYSGEEKIKGFRHIVQGESDHNFLLRKSFLRGIEILGKYDFCYEILVFPHQLGAVLEFVRKFPNQKFVIDHLAKPYIKDGFYDGWAVLMREIALEENVYCKISGMVTEADYETWSYEKLQPYMEWVFTHFGSRRVMFGSDWPVCLVAADYAIVKGITERFIQQCPQEDQERFWSGNAMDFYKI